MSFDFFLFKNISDNFMFLKSDFLGISLINRDVFIVVVSLLVVVFLFFLLYLVGDKIRLFFFRNVEIGDLVFFIDIALGYILVGTAIAILGFFSFLYVWSLSVFLFGIILFALYPFSFFNGKVQNILNIWRVCKFQVKSDIWLYVGIVGFVFIGFLGLIPPETGVDAVWYHTDYPHLYAKKHSIMYVDPFGSYYPIVNPTLSHMLYIITDFFSIKDADRYIHFGFYLLVILLLIVALRDKLYPFTQYAPLLLTTSPVIIHHAPSAYSESQWLICWLATFFVLMQIKNSAKKIAILSGILFGGALATKIWMLQFYPVFILYIVATNIKKNIRRAFSLVLLFFLASILIPSIWYLRAYIITGNPFFPSFSSYPINVPNRPALYLSFTPEDIWQRIYAFINLSPLSIVGLIFVFFKPKNIFLFIKKSNAYIFIGLLAVSQLILPMYLGRFLVPFYSIISIVLSVGIHSFVLISKYFKYSLYIFVFVMFTYYFINSILKVPYGLGWADKNKYLTRVLSRDNSSYYDYGRRFEKFITKYDIVASFGLYGFYYANFDFFYAEDVFHKKDRSLNSLIEKGATKLLVKGGDIVWLCKKAQLKNCSGNKAVLLSSYIFSHLPASQYLYELKIQ